MAALLTSEVNMAGVINNVAVKQQVLQKLQALCQQQVYVIDAWNELLALYNAIPLNTTNVGSDAGSFYDSAVTSTAQATDFAGAYQQMNCATLGALIANMTTFMASPSGALLGQLRIMSGRPMV